MRLNELKAEISRFKGLPHFDKLKRVDRGGSNWHYCYKCKAYAQGTCLVCQNNGSKVVAIGTIGDVWPL